MGPFTQPVSGTATVEKEPLKLTSYSQKLRSCSSYRHHANTYVAVGLLVTWSLAQKLCAPFSVFFFFFPFLNSLSELILSSTPPQAPSSLELRGPGRRDFIILPLSRCISSDAIMINVNHAGFTACLFYGAVGSAELGPSTRAPAGSVRTWTGRGFGGCLAPRLGCNVAPFSEAALTEAALSVTSKHSPRFPENALTRLLL